MHDARFRGDDLARAALTRAELVALVEDRDTAGGFAPNRYGVHLNLNPNSIPTSPTPLHQSTSITSPQPPSHLSLLKSLLTPIHSHTPSHSTSHHDRQVPAGGGRCPCCG